MKKFFISLTWLLAYVGLMTGGLVVYSTTFPPGGGMDPRVVFGDNAVRLACQLGVGIRYLLSAIFVAGAVTILTSDKITG
jgi:hypothetical protein